MEATRRGFMKAGAAGIAGIATMAAGFALADEPIKTVDAAGDMFAGKSHARQILDDLWWVGGTDKRIALFENTYPLEKGVAYNSYLLLDEQTVLIDTVDRAIQGQYFENVAAVLGGRDLDYLIINHMEPDHSSAVGQVISRYPNCKVVCTEMAANMIDQFFELDLADRLVTVAEGDSLTTGAHTLAFVEAPMVHWPEVMVTYDMATGVLFSADAFGCFNSLDGNLYADQVNFKEAWLDEARRYYCNIVGKYGPQVVDALTKASTLDLKMLCSTHGPVWREDLDWIIDKYLHWATYEPEDQGVVIFYGSVYGGTENAANILANQLSAAGVTNVKVFDVSKTHVSWLIAECFRASHLVFASCTYNMGIFTNMKNFLEDLASHNMQNRHVAFIENGSWSPASGKLMREIVEGMPGMKVIGDTVTFLSTPDDKTVLELADLAGKIAASLEGDDSVAEATVAAEAGATRKFKCDVCGYIAEFDGDLPADYVCPICGKDASFFTEVTE